MSMENAILAHANALEKLAEAIAKAFGERAALAAGLLAIDTAQNSSAKETKAETKQAKGKTESDDTATGKVDKAELDKALADAKKENAASKETTTADAGAGSSDTGADEVVLDYLKDVKPRLLAVVKKVGKEKVSALIQTYGVAKAEAVDPAQFADLLEKAEALEK